MITLDTSTAAFLAATATSATFSTALAAGETYVYSATTDTWIAQGALPTASAADGSSLIPAGMPVLISGLCGATLAVVRDSADGSASLTRVMGVNL